MLYILFLIEILLIFIFFILFGKNIITPSLLALLMFTTSTLVAILNIAKWKINISEKTVLISITSFATLCLGELYSRIIFIGNHKPQNNNRKVNDDSIPILVKNNVVLIISLFALLVIIYYYKETVKLAERAGFKSGAGMLLLAYAREASLDEGASIEGMSGLSILLSLIVKSIAYIFAYIFLHNKIKCQKQGNFLLLLPVVLYIPLIVLSAGRTQFIYLIAFCFIIGITFFMQKKNWNPVYVYKILLIGFLAIAIFLVIFTASGSLKAKSSRLSPLDTISIYAGLSIPSLDKYLTTDYIKFQNNYFGEHTLFGIYAILSKFDKTIPHFSKPYEFSSFNGYGGNVYTAIRRYYQDYGYFGLYFMMFFLGFLYSYIFLKNRNKIKSLAYILYCSMLSPIIEISIEERFFLSLINLSNLKFIFFIILFYFIFIEQKKFKNLLCLIFRSSQ